MIAEDKQSARDKAKRKLQCVRFANGLRRLMRRTGIDVLEVHRFPGVAAGYNKAGYGVVQFERVTVEAHTLDKIGEYDL